MTFTVYRYKGHWGAVGKSNFAGLRFREPVHRTLRELAVSYFDVYYNLLGERTLRAYSRPIDLARFDHLQWMTTDKPGWFIPEYLCQVVHTPCSHPSKNIDSRFSMPAPRLPGLWGTVEGFGGERAPRD